MEEIQNMNIGKNGITGPLIVEIKARLKKYKTLKIKMLKSARENSDKIKIAEEVAKKVHADSVNVIGNTFILKID